MSAWLRLTLPGGGEFLANMDQVLRVEQDDTVTILSFTDTSTIEVTETATWIMNRLHEKATESQR